MAKKPKEIKTNVNIHYLIPLAPRSNPYETELREVQVEADKDGMIKCRAVEDADQFETHYFWDEYFQWLVYTNYIIPIEN